MTTMTRHFAGGLVARGVALTVAAACLLALPSAAPAAEELKGGQFAPKGAPAAQYGPDAGRKCSMTPIFRYTLDELSGAAKRAKRPAPEADGQLCAIAEAFLAWDPTANGNPRPQVLQFASRWAGLSETIMPPVIATFDQGDEREIAERVVQSAAGSSALNATRPRIGMAVLQTRRGRDTVRKVAVVVLDAPIQVDPLPRRLEAGQQAVLSGKLLAGAKNPKVYVSDPVGNLSAPEQPPGDAFKAELRCGDRPGPINVEIRAEVDEVNTMVGSFPVACAEPLPTSVALAGEPWPAEADAAEKKMFDLVNEARKAAGATPLTRDPAIAQGARAIAENIAQSGGAPTGPSVVDRLKKEGIASPLVLQSAAAERSFERAHDRLMASPRDRSTLLNREATNAGIGAISQKDADGRPVVYVTEVLIRELPPLDVAKVRGQLREAVAQKRKDARTNPLEDDAQLDEIAQKFSTALAEAGGNLTKEKQDELTSPLRKAFRTVTMVSGAKQEPLDFAEEPQTTSTGKVLGVGVAQGKHPVLGRNAVYVTLMIGTPKGAATEAASGSGSTSSSKKKSSGTKTGTKGTTK